MSLQARLREIKRQRSIELAKKIQSSNSNTEETKNEIPNKTVLPASAKHSPVANNTKRKEKETTTQGHSGNSSNTGIHNSNSISSNRTGINGNGGEESVKTPKPSLSELLAQKRKLREAQEAEAKARLKAKENATKTGNGPDFDFDSPSNESIDRSDNEVSGDSDSDSNIGAAQLDKNQVTIDHFNTEQRAAVELAKKGKSFCLIGGAGTGKTTTVKGVISTLVESNIIKPLDQGTDKVLRMGRPAVAVLSFTNQAVRNIKESLPESFKPHCSTFHNILEYQPEYEEVPEIDEDGIETGEYKNKMRFVPHYGKTENEEGHGALLPHLDVVIIEEAGSIPLDLFKTFYGALPRPKETIFIFLGDLNQVPPIFDDPILGFKLLELPTVELTQVYRNVGLVTRLAQRILEGKGMSDKEVQEWNLSDSSGEIVFHKLKNGINKELMTKGMGQQFKKKVMDGNFTEDDSVILVPFNKHLGSIELNKYIGQGIAERDGLEIYHVIAGFNNHYFCLGDRVLYNKRNYKIVEITPNELYAGEKTLQPSIHVDRWGRIKAEHEDEVRGLTTEQDEDLDKLLAATAEALKDSEGENTTKASHVLKLESLETGEIEEVKTAGGVNNILFTWSLTVHKAQGSEWKNVYFILHESHSIMFQREIIYTGVTRARSNLYVYYSGQNPMKPNASAMMRGITEQKIKGNTLEVKLKHFTAKMQAMQISAQLKGQTLHEALGDF